MKNELEGVEYSMHRWSQTSKEAKPACVIASGHISWCVNCTRKVKLINVPIKLEQAYTVDQYGHEKEILRSD